MTEYEIDCDSLELLEVQEGSVHSVMLRSCAYKVRQCHVFHTEICRLFNVCPSNGGVS